MNKYLNSFIHSVLSFCFISATAQLINSEWVFPSACDHCLIDWIICISKCCFQLLDLFWAFGYIFHGKMLLVICSPQYYCDLFLAIYEIIMIMVVSFCWFAYFFFYKSQKVTNKSEEINLMKKMWLMTMTRIVSASRSEVNMIIIINELRKDFILYFIYCQSCNHIVSQFAIHESSSLNFWI